MKWIKRETWTKIKSAVSKDQKVYDLNVFGKRRETNEKVREEEGGNISELMSTSSAACQVK